MKRLMDLNLKMINYVSQYLKSAVIAMFCLILLAKCSPLLPKVALPFGTPTLSGSIDSKSAALFIQKLNYSLTKAELFDKKVITININSFGRS